MENRSTVPGLTFDGDGVAFSQKLFQVAYGAPYDSSGNPTNYVFALNPFTGAVIWKTTLPAEPLDDTTQNLIVSTVFANACIYEVDATHLLLMTSIGSSFTVTGVTMLNATSGAIEWTDTSGNINPNINYYYPALMSQDVHMFYGAINGGPPDLNLNAKGVRLDQPVECGWSTANPDQPFP